MSDISKENIEMVIKRCGGSDDHDMPTLERIVLQETLNLRPKRPDTPKEAAFRAQVRVEIEAIKKAGLIVDF